ncbi:MAG TPA: (2Fe-2S)-binding protein, partial [Mycobacterium sp.]|nr:(2Fe-2S)-binding protein [Mycobacterium sp.]
MTVTTIIEETPRVTHPASNNGAEAGTVTIHLGRKK